MQTRLSRRVFAVRVLVFGLADLEPCARAIPRAAQACAIIASSSTRQAITLMQSTASDLTTWPAVRCSWESEQSKNGAGGMVPLYAARVQDRGPAMSSCSGAAHVGTRPSFH